MQYFASKIFLHALMRLKCHFPYTHIIYTKVLKKIANFKEKTTKILIFKCSFLRKMLSITARFEC